jgi:hypothetical protein
MNNMTITPFEQILKEKLGDRLSEERRRIALTLMTELSMAPMAPGANVQQKKQKKQAAIQVAQAEMAKIQAKMSMSKNPEVEKAKLTALKDKVKMLQDQMAMIQ